jgi:hypothetical protein
LESRYTTSHPRRSGSVSLFRCLEGGRERLERSWGRVSGMKGSGGTRKRLEKFSTPGNCPEKSTVGTSPQWPRWQFVHHHSLSSLALRRCNSPLASLVPSSPSLLWNPLVAAIPVLTFRPSPSLITRAPARTTEGRPGYTDCYSPQQHAAWPPLLDFASVYLSKQQGVFL